MTILVTIFLFIAFGICTTAGLILLKLSLAGLQGDYKKIFRILFEKKFILGFITYCMGFLIWLYILSKFKLSIIYPIATSLLFVLINAGSYLVFHDRFTKKQILGTAFCLIGIILLSM